MAGLNGTPINGFRIGLATAPDDRWKQEAPLWASAAAGEWHKPEVDEFEAERLRLEAGIEAANERIAVARHRSEQRDVDLNAALRAELVASQECLAEMEREQDMTVEMVRAAARDEVERILAEARQQVASRSGELTDSETAGANDAE